MTRDVNDSQCPAKADAGKLQLSLEFVRDLNSVDAESGIAHYKHMACNMAFICEMMEKR